MDRLNIETMAAAHVRADRLRTIGRSDIEERRLIVQLQRAVGWRSAPVETAKPADPSANAVEWLNSFKTAATDAPPSDGVV
jgi:hypothetical protein